MKKSLNFIYLLYFLSVFLIPDKKLSAQTIEQTLIDMELRRSKAIASHDSLSLDKMIIIRGQGTILATN